MCLAVPAGQLKFVAGILLLLLQIVQALLLEQLLEQQNPIPFHPKEQLWCSFSCPLACQ